jgi:hypothetical protein
MPADHTWKSGKSQGRYRTLPVQTGHNTHGNLSSSCSNQYRFTAYYQVNVRSSLYLTEMLDKTSVKDCVLLCPYHHLIVIHQQGWTLVLNPDGTTTAWNPDRTKVLHSHGPPARAG